jgi:hypothetical protein
MGFVTIWHFSSILHGKSNFVFVISGFLVHLHTWNKSKNKLKHFSCSIFFHQFVEKFVITSHSGVIENLGDSNASQSSVSIYVPFLLFSNKILWISSI